MRFFVLFACLFLLESTHAADLPVPKVPQLMLWVRADDLKDFKDGELISRWVDASGQERDLTASGTARPVYQSNVDLGHPGVLFEKKPTPEARYFHVPLSGEWAGATIFVVGCNLASPGWLDSLPGLSGDLRALGWVQLAGTQAALDQGFPDLATSHKLGIATISAGVNDSGTMVLQTFANGNLQGKVTDLKPKYGIGWRHDISRLGSEFFTGVISEFLVYKGVLSDSQRAQTTEYLAAKYRTTETINAPQTPFGFPAVPKVTDKPVVPTPVTTTPVQGGLKCWLRADDLNGTKSNAPVSEVPNAAGNDTATSDGMHRPRFASQSLNGRDVLRFQNDYQTPREEVQWLKLPPSLNGETDEVTIMIAGRGLSNEGLFDTAPGQVHCLRHIGPIQLTGDDSLVLHNPFPWLRFKQTGVHLPLHKEGQIFTVQIGRNGQGQWIATYADGRKQARNEDANIITPILFRDPHIGTTNLGEARFNGDIGEILIYTRALSDEERQHNDQYLSEKWGVPLRGDKEVEQLESARSRWSLTLPVVPNSQSWLGNTLSGRAADGWVQSGIFDVTALPDGTLAAISVWDEQHKEIGFYKDGKVAGGIKAGGGAITNDGKYLYAAMSGYGKPFCGVRRLTLDGRPAPWPTLPVVDFNGWGQLHAIRFDVPQAWMGVRGLAVGHQELFVSVTGMDEVRVYDAETGVFKRTLSIKGAGKLAVDKQGDLWVALPTEVACFHSNGTPKYSQLSNLRAGGLAVDQSGVLWVAENGIRQQVIGFDISGSTPREIKAIGIRGGVFSSKRPGQLTDDRIMPPKGLAIDARGNITVLGTNVLRTYSPDGILKHQLQCTSFTTCSDFDPHSDGTVIYTGHERYDFVPDAAPGSDWKLTGVTSDARRYPELADGGDQTVLRSINNQLLRYTPSDPILIHRQKQNSDLFAPVGMIVRPDQGGFPPSVARPQAAPPTGRFAWNDLNGNGLVETGEITLPPAGAKRAQQSFSAWIDNEGSIWEPEDREGLRYLPVSKWTTHGAPVYDLADEIWFEKPQEFLQVMRVLYLPRTDTMLLTGTTWDHPAQGTEHWGTCGREIVCYANWKKGERKVLWRAPFPDGALNIKAVTVAPSAHLFFAGEMETMTIFVYDLRNGELLGMVEPNKNLVGDVGWIDIDSGIRAFTRKNGEVLLLSEEVWGQKQMVYRLKPRVH